MVEPAANGTAVCVSSLSSRDHPVRSTDALPVLISSIQSPGVPPLDSTSLIFTVGVGAAQSFAVFFVEDTVVVNGPEPSGQRPYVVVAWAVHVYESTRVVPSGRKRRAESESPSPNPPETSTSTV